MVLAAGLAARAWPVPPAVALAGQVSCCLSVDSVGVDHSDCVIMLAATQPLPGPGQAIALLWHTLVQSSCFSVGGQCCGGPQ
jgi:hypothetical protein